MQARYLEVTFRNGKPLAAYLYLPRRSGVKSVRTEEAAPGVLIDYAAGGEPIGLEITAPQQVTATTLNAILEGLGVAALEPEEFAPLEAA